MTKKRLRGEKKIIMNSHVTSYPKIGWGASVSLSLSKFSNTMWEQQNSLGNRDCLEFPQCMSEAEGKREWRRQWWWSRGMKSTHHLETVDLNGHGRKLCVTRAGRNPWVFCSTEVGVAVVVMGWRRVRVWGRVTNHLRRWSWPVAGRWLVWMVVATRSPK